MTFSMDFSNDKPDIREVIPAGTPVFVMMTIIPGGHGPDGILTKSKPPADTAYMKCEFTVLRGPYKSRKFWSNMTVEGGKLNEKGASIAAGITRSAIRMILDSSQGLKSDDESPEASAKRVLKGLKELHGRKFIAKVKVEAAQNGYPAKNGLGQIMTRDMSTYPTEAQLDAPAVASSVTVSATPPPAWEAPGEANAAPAPAAAVQPAALAFVQPAPPTPAANQDDTLPAWAA